MRFNVSGTGYAGSLTDGSIIAPAVHETISAHVEDMGIRAHRRHISDRWIIDADFERSVVGVDMAVQRRESWCLCRAQLTGGHQVD